MRKKYDDMKEEIKDLKTWSSLSKFFKSIYKTIIWSVEKNKESKNSKVARTKIGRIMLLSKCEMCDSKKSKFIKERRASALLSCLGIKTPLSKIPLVGPVFF